MHRHYRPLTDSEGAILTLILWRQPLTAYEIGKIYAVSPVHTLNTSKGKLYPLIHRLHEHGLLDAEAVPGDKRGTRRFSCTSLGKEAVKRWVLTIRPEDELQHDALRNKLQGFQLLSKEARVGWFETVRSRLARKLCEIERWTGVEEPFATLVQESAKGALQAQIVWLDTTLKRMGEVE